MKTKNLIFGSSIPRFVVIAAFTSFSLSPPSYADMISTEQLVTQERNTVKKVEMIDLLARDEIRTQLISLGVDPSDVQGRIESMTEAELNQLYTNLDELPAGGDALGVVLTLLLIFLVLDIAGVTDVFPGV